MRRLVTSRSERRQARAVHLRAGRRSFDVTRPKLSTYLNCDSGALFHRFSIGASDSIDSLWDYDSEINSICVQRPTGFTTVGKPSDMNLLPQLVQEPYRPQLQSGPAVVSVVVLSSFARAHTQASHVSRRLGRSAKGRSTQLHLGRASKIRGPSLDQPCSAPCF